MSFYASQFNNKSSRYCSSNLYGSNLSTVYADGPPPLDDALEEDDGEIVFRDKSPRRESPEPKFDDEKSRPASGEADFNPWSKNESKEKDVAADDNGDFSGFADFSSAFGGDSISQNDCSWFKNGDNDQSSVTNFNHNFPNYQQGISASSRKNVQKTEEKTSKDDDFGCFSGGDDSDFDDFCAFTDNNESTNTVKTEENSSEDFQLSEKSESKRTKESGELFKNDKTVHSSSDQFNHSLGQNAKKSSFGSENDFDKLSSEVAPTLNGQPISPTNHLNTSAQDVNRNTHSGMKPTCFSDDDDDFGEFSSSSFDDDSGGATKSPELITNSEQTNFSSQPKADERTNINESSIQSKRGIDSKDSNEPEKLPQHNGSGTDVEKNGEDTSENNITGIDQSKENITLDDTDNDNKFGEFSTSASRVTKTEDIKSKELPSSNIGDDKDFGEFGLPPSLQNLQDGDDLGEFGTVAEPSKENDKNNYGDDDFGDFGTASPPSPPSLHDNSDNDDDFGDFGSAATISKASSCSNDGDGGETINFGAVKTLSSAEEKQTSDNGDDDDDFGDFGTAFPPQKAGIHGNNDNDDNEFGGFGVALSSQSTEEKPKSDDDNDDNFGDFGAAPATSNSDVAPNDDNDEFGDFSIPAASKPNLQSDVGAAIDDNDNDDFGDFGSTTTTSKSDFHGINDDDDDDFGDFGVASRTSEQNRTNDFGNFAEVKKPDSQDAKSKSTNESSSLEPKMSSPDDDDDDDEFGQFDSAPSKSSNEDFAGFKSSNNTSKGFADFSSMPQKSLPSSFSAANVPQSLPKRDAEQEQLTKLSGSTNVIKPRQNTNPDRLGNAFKECFTDENITVESNIIIQMIEHEVQSERSRAWQQLLTAEKDGSLRFDWVLSEHQVKMLEGLSMVPVKIQASVSFKPKGQVPTPLFASSMGLLEPVKGVITPFHHIEEINPSQDPFGAPPEVGVQDLGFGKGSKKDTFTLHTDAKDSASDTVSVSSSLDLDFLAPSTTNGDSTKTAESRGLFEDDLLGLGVFSESSPSPKITNGKSQKNIFQFNNTTIPMTSNEGNLSEQAKIVVKDFEDLSFMLSKVLMFPLKSKE